MLKVKIAAGRASDHDRAVADRQDLVSPFVIESKATNDAVIALQSRTPCVVQRVTGLRARRPPFLSAILARRSRDHTQETQETQETPIRVERDRISRFRGAAAIGVGPTMENGAPGKFVAVSMIGAW